LYNVFLFAISKKGGIMKTCVNHPNKKAIAVCHGCGKDYCELCLDEGIEHYYCRKPQCRKLLKEELSRGEMPEVVTCPNCGYKIKIPKNQKLSGKVHCKKCEATLDFNYNPPKVEKKENYIELLSSLNLGDIALIKSILEDGKIDYYVTGENFLGMQPLLQPAVFYVNESHLSKAKELLKDFELHIWGASDKQ
jgi:hypothetical protein